MASHRGMHKVEFYSSLNEIKELYDQGYVVLKILYEEMKKRKEWEMSYWSFLKYAKRELPLKKSTKIEPNDETIQIIEEAKKGKNMTKVSLEELKKEVGA
jgi:hypothetical protein